MRTRRGMGKEGQEGEKERRGSGKESGKLERERGGGRERQREREGGRETEKRTEVRNGTETTKPDPVGRGTIMNKNPSTEPNQNHHPTQRDFPTHPLFEHAVTTDGGELRTPRCVHANRVGATSHVEDPGARDVRDVAASVPTGEERVEFRRHPFGPNPSVSPAGRATAKTSESGRTNKRWFRLSYKQARRKGKPPPVCSGRTPLGACPSRDSDGPKHRSRPEVGPESRTMGSPRETGRVVRIPLHPEGTSRPLPGSTGRVGHKGKGTQRGR